MLSWIRSTVRVMGCRCASICNGGRWKAQGVTNLWSKLRVMGCRSAAGRETVEEGSIWVMCRGRCRWSPH